MALYLSREKKPAFRFHYRELANRVVQASLDAEGFPFEAEVVLTLTDDARMRKINRDMRGIDAPTDVLSFPMISYPSPADFSFIEEQWMECADPDTDEVMLGDIVLSLDRVSAQARTYAHSEKREYAFLIAHSMLHLMGYDHTEPGDAAVMEERQKRILDMLHIERGAAKKAREI